MGWVEGRSEGKSRSFSSSSDRAGNLTEDVISPWESRCARRKKTQAGKKMRKNVEKMRKSAEIRHVHWDGHPCSQAGLVTGAAATHLQSWGLLQRLETA